MAETAAADPAYWYACGFMDGNPPLGGLLLAYLADEFPPGADADHGDVAVAVMARMFADAFACCPHRHVELAFMQWMGRALPVEWSAASGPDLSARP
ncbi:hypothetical protein ACQHIV_41765 [Kribbella sp. GL6]|uniref:hypothetical protein n=1 Tax=Kribbella sp. GL6 TaxID=3419765 RepID=UPI003CFEA8F3